MSEEILKALMQLFAIITKQDEGVSDAERSYVNYFLQVQLKEEQIAVYQKLFDQYYSDADQKEGLSVSKKKAPVDLEKLKHHPILSRDLASLDEKEKAQLNRVKKKIRKEEAKRKEAARSRAEGGKATSVFDSVRILTICQQINQTLSQSQKIIVLVRLFELLKTDNKFTPLRMSIMDTASKVFNFQNKEYQSIYSFVLNDVIFAYDDPNMLIIDGEEFEEQDIYKHIQTDNLDRSILILKVNSVGLYFMRYVGKSELNFNGLLVDKKRIYLFAPGSTIRLPKDKPIYYSEVVSKFLTGENTNKLSVQVKDLSFKFPKGNIGLRWVNMSEKHGRLVGIMGASGAGKSTLLNVLCGIEKPTQGAVLINGIDIHKYPEKVEGLIGYIPQDDLLLEDLTVYQNLFYNAKLCFDKKPDEVLDKMVLDTLNSLGLYTAKDLKVGNPLQKTISGGQRKRLNIGLELIRESSVLFVDEPTSGLSSRDSENVMDLLRELSLKGKVIFVVIHQPSADIYKMFDKIFILDTGGYPIYYGNPVEAVTYFKRLDHQINADEGECVKCGNVDVELIFNIIESQVVDEYGQYTGTRKMSPRKWNANYEKQNMIEPVEEQTVAPKTTLDVPNLFKQWKIFSTRDILSKLSNVQYMVINLLEAPALALIMAFTIRYVDQSEGVYVYGKNENIPAYLFICIIIALFMGLTVSAEEIVKDQRIRKRETFLNLSSGSYYFSKIAILFTISAIQTLSFVLIGNWILGISGLLMSTWIMLFTVSCFANMLGLNISAAFNNAITIYILIPILLIPQMIFSGAMFNFDKLNEWMGNEAKVPLIADAMVSRWAFEALAVHQFKANDYEAQFYPLEQLESLSNFKKVYYLPNLIEKLNYNLRYVGAENEVEILRAKNHLSSLRQLMKAVYPDYKEIDVLDYEIVTGNDLRKIRYYFERNGIQNGAVTRLIDSCATYILFDSDERRSKITSNLALLQNEMRKQNREELATVYEGRLEQLEIHTVTRNKLNELQEHLIKLEKEYTNLLNYTSDELTKLRFDRQSTIEKKKAFRQLKAKHHNNELAVLVKKKSATKKISEKNGELIQLVDPIYKIPMPNDFALDYRAHFFAPMKHLFGQYYNTYSFNLFAIWLLSFVLYLTLFFGVFRLIIESFEFALIYLYDRILYVLGKGEKKI